MTTQTNWKIEILARIGALAAVVLTWLALRDAIPTRWQNVAVIGAILAVNALIKLLWRGHFILAPASWPYLLFTFGLLAGMGYVMNNPIGLLTLPATLALFGLAWFVHALMGPKYGPANEGP
jgi:hypothetical protein